MSEIKVTGHSEPTQRIITGFYSFDRSFINREGDIGLPINIISIYGREGIGKSTLSLTIAGMVNPKGKICYADIEGFDITYALTILQHTGFTGELNLIQNSVDERMIDDLIRGVGLDEKGADVGILDSIGAISPISEEEGDLEDANMGRRAKLAAKFYRKCTRVTRTRTKPAMFIATNHMNPIMSLTGAMDVPGGRAQKYHSKCRIRLVKMSEDKNTLGGYLVRGKVEKNSFGYKNREFNLFFIGGWGVHPGMTAVFDCIELKLATKSKTVKLGDTSYGYVTNMIKNADDKEYFQPFTDALKAYENNKAK